MMFAWFGIPEDSLPPITGGDPFPSLTDSIKPLPSGVDFDAIVAEYHQTHEDKMDIPIDTPKEDILSNEILEQRVRKKRDDILRGMFE